MTFRHSGKHTRYTQPKTSPWQDNMTLRHSEKYTQLKTSPWQDNMTLRHSEKYTQLKTDCEANVSKMHSLRVEVGCRSHASQSFEWMCKVLGLTKEERKGLQYDVENTTLHCGHGIVAARYQCE